MDFPLEEFFMAIAAQHEGLVEEGLLPDDGVLDKHQFQHLVIDALDMMCECGHCDDEGEAVNDKVINWQIAMVSLFGNLDDVDVTISGDGTTNTYEATHLKSGKSASVQLSSQRNQHRRGPRDPHDQGDGEAPHRTAVLALL